MSIQRSAIALLFLLALLVLPLSAQAGNGGIHGGNKVCPSYLEETTETPPSLTSARWIEFETVESVNFTYAFYTDIAQPKLKVAAIVTYLKVKATPTTSTSPSGAKPYFLVEAAITWQLGEADGQIHSMHVMVSEITTCSRNVVLPNSEYRDLAELAMLLREGFPEKNTKD